MLASGFGAARTVIYFSFLLAFFASESLSQITIREKISIDPTSGPELTPMAIGSREWDIVNGFCWKFFLDPVLPEGDSENEYRWLMYGDDGYVYDPWTDLSDVLSIDFTEGAALITVFDAQTGETVGTSSLPGRQYRFRLKDPHPGQDQTYITYRVTGDGWVFFVHTLFIRPTFVLTSFIESPVLHPGDSTIIRMDAVNNCFKDPPLSDSATYSVFITAGAQYGTLINSATADTADTLFSISHVRGFTNSVYFLANGQTPAQDTLVSLRIESDYPNIAPREVSITLSPGSAILFRVSLDPPDTLAFTESSRIFVQATDADSNDVELPGTTLLKFSIDSTDYGSFISVLNDTIPAQLTDVLYSDAKIGNIRFAAVNKNPDSLVNFSVIVRMQEDTSQMGDTTLVLLEQTLKIVMDAPYQILPTKLLGNRTQPVTPDNRKSLLIQLTRGKQGVPNQAFAITTRYVDASGGHDHITPRRMETSTAQRRENFGYFILQRTNEVVDRPCQGVTQSNGREGLGYVASMFGDSMRIVIESTDPLKSKFLRDSITIVEKVDSLRLLGPGDDYVLIGGTCAHNGPSDRASVPQQCRTPNNNHWARTDVVTSLEDIADDYRSQFPDNTLLHINDMSLPLGGRFDIAANWEGYGDHQYHRQGTDVDVRSSTIPGDDRYIDTNRNGRYDPGEPITQDLNGNGQFDYSNSAFTDICLENAVLNVVLEDPGGDEEHYHLYFSLY